MQRRFYTLDALRGVAAILVVLGHSRAWLSPLAFPFPPPAVDLFFMLSGFVIAKAYDPRFRQGMAARQFLLQRYLRLYPLYLVGISIGIVSAFITLALGHGKATVLEFAMSAISGLLLLPSPTWRYSASFMPLNHPAWSLVYEIGINIVFAWTWRWLNSRTLTIIVGCSAVSLAALYFVGDPRGGPAWPTAWMGIPRVSFGFFAGVLIARHYQPACITTPWAWAVPLLMIPMLYWIPNPASSSFTFPDQIIDAAFVLIACPLIILFGARFEPRVTKRMAVLGLISYPLYVVHEPVLDLCWRILIALHLSPERIAPSGGLVFVPVVVCVAWGLAKVDDRFRRVIARRMKRPAVAPNAPDPVLPVAVTADCLVSSF